MIAKRRGSAPAFVVLAHGWRGRGRRGRLVVHGPAGWRELREARGLVPLLVICSGVWLHAADSMLVATMTPSIVAGIGGARLVAWMIALYEIGSIVAGAAGAVLSLRHGLRPTMVTAAAVYLLGCVISALAPAMPVMLMGRLVQGAGGGGLMALALISVSRLYRRDLMPRVMAAISVLWGTSAFVGPLIGGLFADAGHWRGGFWFFAAQAAALALLMGRAAAFDAAGEGRADETLPVRRLALLSFSVIVVAFGGIRIGPVATPLGVVAGLVALLLFLRFDGAARAGDHLLPRHALDPRDRVGAGLLMVLLISAATIPLGVYGPLLLTRLHAISALHAGYVLAVELVAWSLMAVLVARVPERRSRLMIGVGTAIVTAGIAGFVVTVPQGPLWRVIACAAFQGGGFGIAWTFVLARMTAMAPPGERERVAGALTTLQQLGYAFGAAYSGIAANAAGLGNSMTLSRTRDVGFWIFSASLPLALAGLLAGIAFLSDRRA